MYYRIWVLLSKQLFIKSKAIMYTQEQHSVIDEKLQCYQYQSVKDNITIFSSTIAIATSVRVGIKCVPLKGFHAATNWLPFGGSQNSIFRLSLKLNLSKFFLTNIKYGFTTLLLYFTLHKARESRRIAEKLNLYQNYETSTYD